MSKLNPKQTTLKSSFSMSGVGLHTGAEVNLTFHPAPENHGYKFRRTDLPGQPIIEADCDLVTDTSRGTTLEKKGASVSTIEHVLASLVGMEVDNVLLDIDGPEMPIMDGSSSPFVEAIKKVGTIELEAEREYFEIPYNIHFKDEESGVEIIAMPVDEYRLTVMVDYNSAVLGSQHAGITSLAEFREQIAPCRTFCFLHELEYLLDNNLIKGGDLNNAIVVVDKPVEQAELDRLARVFNKPSVAVKKEGILNNLDLRFQNEPARHKLLDMIGDLALVGMPLKGQIMAARPGHASNVAFAKKIKQVMKKELRRKQEGIPHYDPNQKPLYTTAEIMRMLPHKHPFLLVDKILSKTETSIVAVKNITYDQPFFSGHFPGDPIMPGVLQLEAMAQAGGVLILSTVPDPENYGTLFLKIDNAKFKDKVVPGDTLVMKMELIEPIRRGICVMRARAWVGDKLVSEAEMMASIVRIKGDKNIELPKPATES
ncbi:MAG: bifunctional UDP-3-O-[3-hydroxymyristoyl] N-acetylglucosamine deacetylase/3-hydroxyacyl-ACP dehydratase [Bacteroidetes bacterium]|nr:bifunctional UDP-3-O-[3-hydroxymyristoyl] N-acetylglucosamine deacetylase/3-hydroxyacyl-ACP dehydratase [Bacteroidota bacterium]